MAFQVEKGSGDILINGWEKGIATSPHKGIASIKNANINTEMGEVMCNFIRSQQNTSAISSTTTPSTLAKLHWPVSFGTPYINQAVNIGAGVSDLAAGIYWVSTITGTTGAYLVEIVLIYNGLVAATWSAITGSATIAIISLTSSPVSGALETYFSGSATQYRYYIAETAGYVWVLDTGLDSSHWNLIDKTQKSGITGITVCNGQLFVFQSGATAAISTKWTVLLGQGATPGAAGYNVSAMNNFLNAPTNAYPGPHFCLVGHQSTLNYTDANFVATIIPDSTSSLLNANVYSYGKFTASSTTITVNPLYAGSFPVSGQTMTFNTDTTLYSGIGPDTVYYVKDANASLGTFTVATTVNGSAISLSGGAGGQYFNSFNPRFGTINGNVVGGTNSTFIGTPQACTLPAFETTQALAELGNTLIIGTSGNTLYQWDQVSAAAENFIPLAEASCAYLLTVNNVVFVFTGQKGNIYVTTGSAASGVLTVPDYLAGIPGTPTSYIEPYFTWGQAFFSRGRVFFSLQDQTASKTGNCGGIYSFVPSFFNPVSGEDAGLSLRLENFNSYGTYNGLANVLIPNQNQSAIGVQYFSGWTSTISNGSYGIDTSGTTPYADGSAIIETDILPSGEILGLQKKTFSNIEFKLSSPLVANESVTVNYRVNLTDAWASAGTVIYDNDTAAGSISGYISPLTFQNTQWLQLQIILTSTTSSPSFTRLTDLRIREN